MFLQGLLVSYVPTRDNTQQWLTAECAGNTVGDLIEYLKQFPSTETICEAEKVMGIIYRTDDKM